MTTVEIRPARRARGVVRAPGDKSIGHRAALIGAIADGVTTIRNFPPGADCGSTLHCLEALGVKITRVGGVLSVVGRGLGGLAAPGGDLDAGNSGTTVRLLAGILAGHPFTSTFTGDASLSRRPMGRIVEPLRLFGARVEAVDGHLPLTIEGGVLRGIHYRTPVASAQVKSAVLLAGLHAEGATVVEEASPTRDHTEIALAAAGAKIQQREGRVEVEGGARLAARDVTVPGDPSSAAFLVAAALILPDSELRVRDVGVNPTRALYLSVLQQAGAAISLESERQEGGEAVADLVVRSSRIGRIEIAPEAVPLLIDELPILAVVGACMGGAEIRGAGELRHKESDRIRALASNLAAIGASVEEFEDGLTVEPSPVLAGGSVPSFGDHRIAMALAVAGLGSREGVRIEDAGCVDISFPGFFELLDTLVER